MSDLTRDDYHANHNAPDPAEDTAILDWLEKWAVDADGEVLRNLLSARWWRGKSYYTQGLRAAINAARGK